jgi:hypothetical protein
MMENELAAGIRESPHKAATIYLQGNVEDTDEEVLE